MTTVRHSLSTVFNKLTMPQALVINGGLIFAAAVFSGAFRNGWAPDFDFQSGKFSFIHYSQPVER
jgi:hypothetical protein